MFEFVYMEMTGSVPFDLAFSLISFFAVIGYFFKAIKTLLVGRRW